MATQRADTNHVLDIFRKKKVITLDELATLLTCSIPTIRNRLKAWKTYRSYNKNGRYYTLPEVPKFDPYGIWKFKKIFFSQYGNLKQTLVHLVHQSQAGLSAMDMSHILGIAAHSFLSHFKNLPDLEREKHKERYIYFSKIPEVSEKQKKERQKRICSMAALEHPSDAETL